MPECKKDQGVLEASPNELVKVNAWVAQQDVPFDWDPAVTGDVRGCCGVSFATKADRLCDGQHREALSVVMLRGEQKCDELTSRLDGLGRMPFVTTTRSPADALRTVAGMPSWENSCTSRWRVLFATAPKNDPTSHL